MTTAMKAAFTLTLEDKLTTGLQRLQKQFETLKNKGGELNLGKLEKADAVLRTLGREVRNLTSDMRAVESTADRAWAAMKRMASVSFNKISTGVGNVIGPHGKLGGLTGALGGMAAGYTILKPVQSYADFQNVALHSAITQGLNGKAATVETNRLMGLFNKDALETGQSSMNIAQAYQDLIQTGMTPQRAEALLPIHSRAATAYNISPEALGHAVFALSDSFKIGEADMPGALASMALAAKSGRFKVEDFSHFLPSIGGDLSKLGMTGRGSADQAFAALETVMKYSAEPGSGAANFTQLMNDLTAPHTARQFALHNRGMAPETKAILEKYHVQGINLPKLLEDARTKGIDPLTAVLRTLHKVTDGLPSDVKGEVLGAFFPNMEARTAVQSMLDHKDEMEAMRKRLGGADTAMLGRDFDTAHSAPIVTLRTGEEAATQIERRAGVGFEPVVDKLVGGLQGVVSGIDAVDLKLPGFADSIFTITAAILAGVSALGVAGFVAPAVAAGGGLLAGIPAAPVLAIAAPELALGALQTPEVTQDLNQRLTGNPMDTDQDGFGPGSRPLDLTPPPPSTLEVTIKTDPGTTATVTGKSDNVKADTPNPGPTLGLE